MTIPTDNNLINQFVGAATFANGPGGPSGARSSGGGGGTSWYEAMSRAWGQTLDAQASEITSLSDQIGTLEPGKLANIVAVDGDVGFVERAWVYASASSIELVRSDTD